jgi:peptidyl-prolyl cis-trans isomerase SurA
MKISLFRLLLTLTFGLFLSGSVWAVQPVNGIAAVVGSGVITEAQLDQAVAQAKQRIQASKSPMPSDKIIKTQIIQQLINQQLQLDLIKKAHLTLKPAQLNAVLKRIAAQNKMTVNQLYAKVKSKGFTPKDFRDQIRKQALVQMLQQQQVGSRVSVSQQEISDFMNTIKNSKNADAQYHIMDILIALPDEPTTAQVVAARFKATQLIKQLKAGKNFKQLAASESGGSEALKGGDLGWNKLAELPTPFVSTVESMKVNQVGGPIQTANGFHVIKLLGTKDSQGPKGTPKQQREQVAQMLYQQKYQEALMTWIGQLRSQVYIKIYK